eukprot:gene4349-4928_t
MGTNEEKHLEELGKEAAFGDDVAFMDMVKEFPCIYNRGSPQFQDKNLKMNAWKRIAKFISKASSSGGDSDDGETEAALESQINASKQRYENIRTLFSRYLKKMKPPSGSGSDQVVIDQRYEHLRWLMTFIRSRSTSGSMPSIPMIQSPIDTSMSETQEQVCIDEEEIEEEMSSNDEDFRPGTISIQKPETPTSSTINTSGETILKKQRLAKTSSCAKLCGKRPWAKEQKAANPDIELCKVMHNFQKSLTSQTTEPTISADMHYCMSLAERMAALDGRMKAYVRHQIEKIFLDTEFGSGMYPQNISFQGPQLSSGAMFQQYEFGGRRASIPQHSREGSSMELNRNQYTSLQ